MKSNKICLCRLRARSRVDFMDPIHNVLVGALLFLTGCSSTVNFRRMPQSDPVMLLEISPGQIDEVTATIGAKDVVRSKGGVPFGRRYLAARVSKNIDGSCEVVESGNRAIKNCDILGEDAFQSDDILLEISESSGTPVTVTSYKVIPEQNRVLPLIWCATSAQGQTSVLQRSYFISLEETQWSRPSDEHASGLSKGKAHIYVFEHSNAVVGNDRFDRKHLKFEKFLPWMNQVGASNLSGSLTYGMHFQNEYGEYGSLIRVNQTMKFDFKTKDFTISARRLAGNPKSNELLCVGIRSIFRP